MDKLDQFKRAVLGYSAGAGLVVVTIAVMTGPYGFAIAFLVGAAVATLCGIFILLPIVALLIWVGQLRIWWAILLAPVILLAGSSILFPPDDLALILMFRERGADGQLLPDWRLITMAALAALAALVGWLVAFGFRTRPESQEREPLA